MPVIGDMSDLQYIHPISRMSPISDIGDKMVNWDEGDICEIHDSPDECGIECFEDDSDDPGEDDIWESWVQK